MTYPPPPQGYPGGPPNDPYGQQPDPYAPQQPQYPPPADPYAQQQPQYPPANDPYAQQPDPYAPQPDPYTSPAADAWGAPQQSSPGGYNPAAPPMSAPPMSGPPMSGPPVSGPGAMGQPGYGQPGMPQPGMGGFGAPMPQPQKSGSTGLIIGAVVGVVLLLALGTFLVINLGGSGDDDPPTGQQSSAPPSEEPSDPPSEDPVSENASYLDYAAAWSGSYEGTSLFAEYYNGWDYASCSDVAYGTKLADSGCQYAFEIIHDAEGGDVRVSQLVLAMEDSTQASDLQVYLNDAEFEDDYRFQVDSLIADYEQGLWIVDNAGSFVILTVTTRTTGVEEETMTNYLYSKADDMVSELRNR